MSRHASAARTRCTRSGPRRPPGPCRVLPATDIDGTTALTTLLLPDMLARRRGGVLNVASTAAFQGHRFVPRGVMARLSARVSGT